MVVTANTLIPITNDAFYGKPTNMTLSLFPDRPLIRRDSVPGMAEMHTAVMPNKLKAADPTMAPGPKSPALKSFPTISMMDRRISGAEDPSAIRVRFATVSFQMRTSMISGSCESPLDKYT